MIRFTPHDPNILGYLPYWLSEADPRPARDQLNEHYQHGGGWNPFTGHTLRNDNSIKYPGDPVLPPRCTARLREETICVYDHAWVAIIQPDRSFEVCRMD